MASAITYLDARSALGLSLTESVNNLLTGHSPWSWKHFDHLHDPLKIPYFAIPTDSTRINLSQDLYLLLSEMVADTIGKLSLTPNQLMRTGIAIGSSSFEVAACEYTYCEELNTQQKNPLTMRSIGYSTLSHALGKHYKLSPYCYSYNTACTSSSNALLYAHRMLEAGLIDRMIVIGMELFNHTSVLGFHSLGLISPSQRVKSFAENRDGLVLGEAISLAVLTRGAILSSPPELEICGGAINTDNFSLTAAISDGSSFSSVMLAAFTDAHITADDIQGIKSHGTASLMNDEAEAAGLHRVYSSNNMPPLFALKPYCGHTLGASGALELALTAGCLLRNIIPPHPHHEPDPTLGLTLSDKPAPAPDGYYLLNCFAFGGNNNSLILRKNTRDYGHILCT